ncbi:MAG: hypothetical protein NTW03_23405 [Verrucomicrobia bacterium]|nr:hypothetical protein [Verrucomicrobiota bacterium]
MQRRWQTSAPGWLKPRRSCVIRNGEVDAVLVGGERREQVYILTRADHVYRQIIETMSEGAATVSAQGAMVGRELRMIELKKEGDELCCRLGEPPRQAGPLPLKGQAHE